MGRQDRHPLEVGGTGTPCTTWEDKAEESGCIGTHRGRKYIIYAPPGRIDRVEVRTSETIRYMYSTKRVHEIVQRGGSERRYRYKRYIQDEKMIIEVVHDDTMGHEKYEGGII